jgi:WD40 repeat protein
VIATMALAAFAGACGSDEPASPTAQGTLVVTPARLVLGQGISRRLSAALLDDAGEPLPGAEFAFISSDPSLAEVTPDGLVSYVGAGEAEIRVTSEALLAVIPYTGLRSGHPVGRTVRTRRLPGDRDGDGPFAAAVGEDGRILISQTHGGRLASAFYPDTGFAILDLEGTPTSIVLLAGGTALVTPTGPDNEDATVVELSSERVLTTIPLDVTAPSAVTTSDSETVYLGTNDGRVLELDVASSTVTGSIDLRVTKGRANHLALHPAGTLLYASSFTTGTISEIDLASKSIARTFVVGGEPQGMAVSSDGAELYVADESGSGDIDVYDLAGTALVTSIPSGATSSSGGPFGLAISPDGSRVYVGVIVDEGPGLIQVIDVASHKIERTIISCGGIPRRIVFGYSGGLAVIPDETGCATFVE